MESWLALFIVFAATPARAASPADESSADAAPSLDPASQHAPEAPRPWSPKLELPAADLDAAGGEADCAAVWRVTPSGELTLEEIGPCPNALGELVEQRARQRGVVTSRGIRDRLVGDARAHTTGAEPVAPTRLCEAVLVRAPAPESAAPGPDARAVSAEAR